MASEMGIEEIESASVFYKEGNIGRWAYAAHAHRLVIYQKWIKL